jgi:dihydroflavonol-4-reductase
MKVLVTGATGFIGSQLCRALAARGWSVRAFHRPDSKLDGLQGLDVEHAVGDVTDIESVERAVQGIEVVFHTAAKMGRSNKAQGMYTVTVEGTRNVLSAALSAGVRRVVHTSSVAALGVPLEIPTSRAGNRPEILCMDEYHTWNFRPEWWRYGHAKYLAEIEVQKAVARGLDVVITNPTVVIGPGDLNRISGNILIQVARGRVPVAVPGGLNVVHIEDVIRGHLLAFEHGKTGERYILGGENLTHLRFLQIAASVTGARPPLFTVPAGVARAVASAIDLTGRIGSFFPVGSASLRRAGFFFYYNTRKAEQQLGLQASHSVRQAVEDACRWFREHHMM